jgi:hypothetical protein
MGHNHLLEAIADGWLAGPGSDQVILGACLARLVCW